MNQESAIQRQKRLARGVSVFVALAVDDDFRELQLREGRDFEPLVRQAIASMEEMCGSERGGAWANEDFRNWVRGQLSRMSSLVDAQGVSGDVGLIAQAIVERAFPGASQWLGRLGNH
jgi:hypothetical protein